MKSLRKPHIFSNQFESGDFRIQYRIRKSGRQKFFLAGTRFSSVVYTWGESGPIFCSLTFKKIMGHGVSPRIYYSHQYPKFQKFNEYRQCRSLIQELKRLIQDRPPQVDRELLPWTKILFNSQVNFFNVSWFAGTGCLVAVQIYAPR